MHTARTALMGHQSGTCWLKEGCSWYYRLSDWSSKTSHSAQTVCVCMGRVEYLLALHVCLGTAVAQTHTFCTGICGEHWLDRKNGMVGWLVMVFLELFGEMCIIIIRSYANVRLMWETIVKNYQTSIISTVYRIQGYKRAGAYIQQSAVEKQGTGQLRDT